MCKKMNDLISSVWVLCLVLTSAAEAVDPGLVGWWKFDEGSGSMASDSSGNDNHGFITGAVWTKSAVEPTWRRLGPASPFAAKPEEVTFPLGFWFMF